MATPNRSPDEQDINWEPPCSHISWCFAK